MTLDQLVEHIWTHTLRAPLHHDRDAQTVHVPEATLDLLSDEQWATVEAAFADRFDGTDKGVVFFATVEQRQALHQGAQRS